MSRQSKIDLYAVAYDMSNKTKVIVRYYKLNFRKDDLSKLARIAHDYISDVMLNSDHGCKIVVYDTDGVSVRPNFRCNSNELNACDMVINAVRKLPF